MCGNGAAIGMAPIITAKALERIHKDPLPAPTAFVAAGRGTAARSTAGWLIAASTAPVIATASLVFVLPGLSKPLYLLPF